MRVSKATPVGTSFACLNYHYAKAIPARAYSYNIWNDKGEWCGVVVFSSGANKHIGREYGKYQGQVLELVRVALNGKQEQTSQAVALCLKMLHKEAPWVDLVISYADLDQKHKGTIYQASNWIYTGLRNVNATGAIIIRGKKTHPRSVNSKYGRADLAWLRENIDPHAKFFVTAGKHKYIYPMNKEARKKYEILREPYPEE